MNGPGTGRWTTFRNVPCAYGEGQCEIKIGHWEVTLWVSEEKGDLRIIMYINMKPSR